MSHATAAYLFEYKVCGALAAISAERLGGELDKGGHSFLLQLDRFGGEKGITEHPDPVVLDALRLSNDSFLLYDPFEFPEHTFIEWHCVSQQHIEAALHILLEPCDFKSRIDSHHLAKFPHSHSVMF